MWRGGLIPFMLFSTDNERHIDGMFNASGVMETGLIFYLRASARAIQFDPPSGESGRWARYQDYPLTVRLILAHLP
jgi:hypothetical protein